MSVRDVVTLVKPRGIKTPSAPAIVNPIPAVANDILHSPACGIIIPEHLGSPNIPNSVTVGVQCKSWCKRYAIHYGIVIGELPYIGY